MRSLRDTFAHLFHPRSSNNHRPRIIHPEGYLVFLLIITVVSGCTYKIVPWLDKQGNVLGYSSSITQQKVIDETNREREKQGLNDLVENSELVEAADLKAQDMFANQYWAHYSPGGKSPWDFMKSVHYVYSVAGENLARDFLNTDDMVQAWMNSPTHRENMLNPKYKEIGVAVRNGTLKGVETTLVVQMFGTQLSGQTGAAHVNRNAQEVEVETVPIPQVESGETIQQPIDVQSLNAATPERSVLALSLETLHLGTDHPLLSPLHLSKALFLAIIMIIVSVLIYDFAVVENLRTVRFVWKNFAHIALFLTVSFLIIFFKAGSVM